VLTKLRDAFVVGLSFFFESRAKFFLLLLLLAAPAAMLTHIVNDSHPASFTVMITDMSEQSGGSGSIIANTANKSIILTNAHVCDVLNDAGGLVKKEDGSKYMVTGYHKSKFHDLCAVWVAADLKSSVSLADKAPASYSEATITGHPSLLPNVINKGSFGERKFIDVMTGVKKCTKKNVRTEEDALYCVFFGIIPVITTYESVTVSAMIMGGSSGSAVLNDKGELSGVVFAGQGNGLSYAFIVPFEYVSIFINEELRVPTELTKVPLEPSEEEEETVTQEEVFESKKRISSLCNSDNKKAKEVCAIFRQDVDFIQ
jgi:S1-C subfamily serine protease